MQQLLICEHKPRHPARGLNELHPVATEHARNTRVDVPYPAGREIWACLEFADQRGKEEFQLSRSRLPATIRHEQLQYLRICKEVGYTIAK